MIRLTDITKSYNGERVLKNINLTINDGEFVSIMGPSGSGKSTLLKVLGGFLSPDQGSVSWDGEDIYAFTHNQMSQFRCSKMGFVFQSFNLISTLSIKDNIMLPALLSGACDEKRLEEYVSILGISEILNKYPSQVSGGQQQRSAIIRALLYNPSVLILDEPTGALDSAMSVKVMQLIKRINKENNTSIIQVTHSQEVASYGTKLITIKDGEICG